MTTRIHNVFSVASSVVVVVTVVWGAVLVGSPGTARLQRFDQQRLNDLQTISREVQLLCHDPDIKKELKRALPDTLVELAALARSKRINLTDPVTGERYVYTVKDGTTYELCATFTLERDSDVEVFGTTRRASTASPSMLSTHRNGQASRRSPVNVIDNPCMIKSNLAKSCARRTHRCVPPFNLSLT